MTQWQIRIPHKFRDESLIDVASHARHLDGDDRAVTREITMRASIAGLKTAGELLNELEAVGVDGRRRILESARAACGLPSTETVAARERSEAATAANRQRMLHESRLQACSAAGCDAVPTDELGQFREVDVTRWHCPAHVDQAAPGDMSPRRAPWAYSPSGVIVETDASDALREQAALESRQRRREAQQAERALEVAAREEQERARREALERELPPHLRSTA